MYRQVKLILFASVYKWSPGICFLHLVVWTRLHRATCKPEKLSSFARLDVWLLFQLLLQNHRISSNAYVHKSDSAPDDVSQTAAACKSWPEALLLPCCVTAVALLRCRSLQPALLAREH